ncbi:MAG: LCP family protein [Suipraeoptans sp.]
MKDSKNDLILDVIMKIMYAVQVFISALALILLYQSRLLPNKYYIVFVAVIVILLTIDFLLMFVSKRIKVIGLILGLIIIIAASIGIVYLNKTNDFIEQIASVDVKTDNMIVVVKNSDPAETLLQAYNYRFGIQAVTDTENTDLMLDEIEGLLNRELFIEEYDSFEELGEALLQGRVNAIIYNEAYQGIIEDAVEDFDTETRILYQYGVHTEIDIIQSSPDEVKEPFSIFISGIDVRGPITTNSRSDVNIIMTVNPEKKKILLTTTPRDYYVEIPGISGGQKDKLTHAGIYGVDYSIKTLEALYDTEIKYYVRLNFESFSEIVDALGGITVDSEIAFTTRHGNYEISEGTNALDGEQALGFVRERYSFMDGDNQRGKNQQLVLTAIIDKLLSPQILTNYTTVLAAAEGGIQTNMSAETMALFVQYQLDIGIDYEVESIAAIGTNDRQVCFSGGSKALSVMQPHETTVNTIKEKIREVLSE